MVKNWATERLIQALDNIDAKIKYLENSPHRDFILLEYDTISLFHCYNMSFRYFWNKFDQNSASQVFEYMEISKRFSDLCEKYESMLNEQMDYLGSKINSQNNYVDIFPPEIFSEEEKKEFIDYYQDYLGGVYEIIDRDDMKPMYRIGLTTRSSFGMRYERLPQDTNYYELRCDNLYNLHYETLINTRNCLYTLLSLIRAAKNYPYNASAYYRPKQEDIVKALESGLCQYAKEKEMIVERDLQKTAQLLKTSRNEFLNSEIWGRVMEEEDDLYYLAISGQLENNREKRFEFIKEEQRKQLTDNALLLQIIKSTAIDGELFDTRLSVETHNLLSSLNADNLDLFYELVLRRNIIQREMFPEELRAKYDEWVAPSEGLQPEEDEDAGLSEARQSKLDEIISKLQNGQWKEPATSDNIAQLLNAVFGRDLSSLDESDKDQCERMWAWAEGSSGNRMEIVPANLAGFFSEENLLSGSPKEISNDLFGMSNNQSNNINKGYSKRCSIAFKEVLPFLKKYTAKIVRQG